MYPPPHQGFVQPPPGGIICPNPNCRFVGMPLVYSTGGSSGCLGLALLFFGILPGVLYFALSPAAVSMAQCPQCRVVLGPYRGVAGPYMGQPSTNDTSSVDTTPSAARKWGVVNVILLLLVIFIFSAVGLEVFKRVMAH